nr:uncharacterized protein LOC127314563 [Lolium perenne]
MMATMARPRIHPRLSHGLGFSANYPGSSRRSSPARWFDPGGWGQQRKPADRRVEASEVESARWVFCILWRPCSRSDCCSWELRMVHVATPLFDLGLAAMHAGIASWPWLNSLLAAIHTVVARSFWWMMLLLCSWAFGSFSFLLVIYFCEHEIRRPNSSSSM